MKLISLKIYNNKVWAILTMDVDSNDTEITKRIYDSIYKIGKECYINGQDCLYGNFIIKLMKEYEDINLTVNRIDDDLMDNINLEEIYDKIKESVNQDMLDIYNKINNLKGFENEYDLSRITVQELIDDINSKKQNIVKEDI